MSNLISIAFGFMPVAIFSGIFFFVVLFIKYTKRLTIRSVGSDICLGALGNIGMESSSKKLDDAVDQAIWSLKEVGRYAIADGLDSSIEKSARPFARLAIQEKEKVTATLKDISKYFDVDEAERFGKFGQEYTSALNAARTH